MEKELFTVNPVNQQSINQLLLEGKFEEAQELLKKTISSEKEEKAKYTVEVLGGPRSAEAKKLAEQSNGKIVLRPDGKIDFPELGIKGMGRLSVEGPTDLENGLVQVNHIDKFGNTGVKHISYMNTKRALQEATKLGKNILGKSEAREIKQLLKKLGANNNEKTNALETLFGSVDLWDTYRDGWKFDNVDDGSVPYVSFDEWSDDEGPQSFFSFDILTTVTDVNELKEKAMSAEKEDRAEDTVEVLGGLRSAEARKLAEQSNGKIVLRPDGKIDFPELGIKGMGRLSVEGPTDLENGLVQGDYIDKYGDKGVPGISYMTGERAMEEVKKQGKKLLPTTGTEKKTKALLATLGKNPVDQKNALQALFGVGFSGYWYPYFDSWSSVGIDSCFGVSEVFSSTGNISTIKFNSHHAYQCWVSQKGPREFLACEDC